jgi:hypothetical protein
MLGTYVGTADKIVTGGPGTGVHAGSARWSAHPELIVFWADHITDYQQTAAVAYDKAGKVIGALSYQHR